MKKEELLNWVTSALTGTTLKDIHELGCKSPSISQKKGIRVASLRDYQQLKSKYILPKTVYNQTIWRIRDYYRLKEEASYLLEASGQSLDDMPKSKSVSNPVENIAIKREKYMQDIYIIEKELKKIPEEYQRGIWHNIMFGERYPCDAGRTTYGRYKSQYIHSIAHELKLI